MNGAPEQSLVAGEPDLAERIHRWAQRTPDKPALRFHDAELTYAELDRQIGAVAGGLGLARGERIAFCAANRPEQLVLLFACARLGAICVPLNARLTPPELAHCLRDSGASALVAEPSFLSDLAAHRADLPDLQWTVELGTEEWEALLSAEAGIRRGCERDDLLIVYTSGTTGRPKGAVLTQRALSANAVNATQFHDLTSADHVLTVIPLFHVGGLNIQTTPALLAGATVTLHPRFEPAAWLSEVARLRPTTSVLVPATMQAVIADPAWPTADLSSLRMLVTGSAVVPPRLIEAFHARGVPVCQVYGLTETGPIAVHQRPEDALTHLGSTGLEAALTEARIVDADDRDVEGGRSGELLLRGPNVFRAYWRNATATESAFDNAGWFRTGDVGHRLPDGHIVIDDRVKDMVISGGENVYPAEVEQVLSTSPELQEVAVVGAPDDRWGEVLVAVAVRVPGSAVSEADVLALCDGRLARFKQPRRVVFVDQLPRNAMGKVLKHELRAGLVAG